MSSPHPLIDLVLYVVLPIILGIRTNSYGGLVRAVALLCLIALMPQMLLDRYCGSVIPGVGYLLVGIPALLIATICFLIRRFLQRRLHRHAPAQP